MSGHSKWAGIKHKKALVDAKRSNTFTKLANNITVAARHGGGDISMNPPLRTAVEAARKSNMPKDNIDRAIKRGTGELGGSAVEELLYEGFGPGNVAMLVEILTDNRNRSGADVKLIFQKNGGRVAEGGGIAYQFTQKGVIRLVVSPEQVDRFEETVIEGGGEDYQLHDGHATVYTQISDLHSVRDVLEQTGFSIDSAAVEYVPNIPIEVEDDETLEKLSRLIDSLEEYDDVTNVFTNLAE